MSTSYGTGRRRWRVTTGGGSYGSLIRAYCEGIHQITLHRLDKRRRLEVVEDFYDNVNKNIRHFLKDKEKVLTIHIEQIQEEFPIFWEQIGAEGDQAP